MSDLPMRYNISTDEMVPVTQEWVQYVEREFAKFVKARQAAKKIVNSDVATIEVLVALNDFLDAWRPEFEQKVA